MRKIFLSAGHSNKPGKDRGAVSGPLIEGDLTVKVRDAVAQAIIRKGGQVIIDDPSLITVETVKAWRSKIGPSDIAIDIHFNVSGNTDVEGVEVLVPQKPQPLELQIADKISDIIGVQAKTTERGRVGAYDGVKLENQGAHKKLLWMSLPGNTVLVECQFMSDKKAMADFLTTLPVIADLIGDYLVQLQRNF